MNAASTSASTRGRSLSRSSRGSRQKRAMVSRSLSSASRSFANNLRRTYPYSSNWTNSLADPFSARTVCIMRYSTNVNLDATTSVNATYVFRANSIFDPDYTGTGHQPYGHDQYAAIYENYRVKSCTIVASSGSTGSNNLLGVCVRATSSAITDPEQVREIKGTRYTALANDTRSIKVCQKWKLTDQVTSDGCEAAFGSNPDTAVYFHVWTATNGSAEPTALAVCVDLTYVVECWEPKNLGVS